ncbi:hypothetical protein EVAR_3753_1 [Eumeta japonica]|uniref:Uncharacterized protein n=1 Tax=Eumeta variegata TaxID=151549 RepID=A0A4C1SRQ7_EUMVA|nr:hypothetical protein EVAR_3753_1 [Eumeta japonica]
MRNIEAARAEALRHYRSDGSFGRSPQEANWSVAEREVVWFPRFRDANYNCFFSARGDLFHEGAPVIVANLLYAYPHFTLEVTRTGLIRWGGVHACAAQGCVFGSQ